MNTSMVETIRTSRYEDRWCLAPQQSARHDVPCFLVAVASAGGSRVDGNFDDTESFLLYEKSAHDTCFIGRQPCSVLAVDADPVARVRLLADCDLVLCTGISDVCRDTLFTLGIACELAYAGAPVSEAVSVLAQ